MPSLELEENEGYRKWKPTPGDGQISSEFEGGTFKQWELLFWWCWVLIPIFDTDTFLTFVGDTSKGRIREGSNFSTDVEEVKCWTDSMIVISVEKSYFLDIIS